MPILSPARAMMETSDDTGFCDLLLMMLQVGDDEEMCLSTLYEPRVLERLQQMRTRNAPVFFGQFLGPLRRLYPRKVFAGDLFAAMQYTSWESQGEGGSLTPEGFRSAALEYYHKGGSPGVRTGWYTLDQHYTVRLDELTVVTGIASHQKTTWLQALCVNLARDYGWQFALFSPEQYPLGILANALVECYTGLSMTDMPPEMFRDAMGWVAEHFHPIVAPDEIAPTLPWILAVARHQAQQYPLKGLVIDPYNEIDHQIRGNQSETNYISDLLSRLRRFGRAHHLHVWLVAHPTKLQKATSGRYKDKYPPPKPYDISGSSHFYNKPDNCLCIWRDVEQDATIIEVHVQKVRYRSVGRPGAVELHYNLRRFEDVDVRPVATARELY